MAFGVANLALRFLLELGGFVGAGFAAYALTDGSPTALRWLLAVVAAVAVIGLWGAFLAPRRRNGLSQERKDVLGSVLLLVVAVSIGLAGQPGLAIGFGLAVVLNAALLFVFGQDAREQFGPGQPR